MKKYVLFVMVLGLFTITSYAQQLNDFTHSSSSHHLVKGTNISIIPPDKFIESNQFKGFQNPNDLTSMIMVMEIPGPFLEVSSGFNKEKMAIKGMDLLNKEVVIVNGYQGVLVEFDQSASDVTFSKSILLYGDKTFSTMVNAMWMKDSIRVGKLIKESIKTTFVDTLIKVNVRSQLSYSIDESKGGLQFNSVIGNGMFFNRDGLIPTQSKDQLVLVTDRSYLKVNIVDEKAFCLNILSQFPKKFQLVESKGMNKVQIDGLKGYGFYANSPQDLNSETYMVLLFDDSGGYFLFIASYTKGIEQTISDAKQVIQSFKRR